MAGWGIVEAEMRGFDFVARGARMLVPALSLLFLAWVPQAAVAGPTDPIPDLQIDADEFDDTIAFTPADDADAAMPPLEVHEVDASKAAAAGATKVVDGKTWLDADNYQRNDILNLVEEDTPEGTDLVIDVSTGDIWQVPLAGAALLPDAFQVWTDEEYRWLDEDWEPSRLTLRPLTRKKFLILTEADRKEQREEIEVHPVKSFGPVGHQEVRTMQGLQVALMATWLRETPVQRYLRLVMLHNYFSRLPQFKGADNRLIFALMVPDGALFVLPYFQYRYMLARSGIQPWSPYDMAMLPVVLTALDRQIRGERFILGPVKEP
jgi:hypothetical protein